MYLTLVKWACGVVVSMFDFHRSDVYDYTIERHPLQVSENHKPRSPKPYEGNSVVRWVPDETQD